MAARPPAKGFERCRRHVVEPDEEMHAGMRSRHFHALPEVGCQRLQQGLAAHRPAYFEIALANSGSPEADAAMDIDGAIFTLKFFARAGAALAT